MAVPPVSQIARNTNIQTPIVLFPITSFGFRKLPYHTL